MECNIGDKVRFLNDVGGGKIVGFANKTTAIVRDNDGFDIPTLISELVIISDTNNNEQANKQFTNRKETDKNAEEKLKKSLEETIKVHDNNNLNNNELITAFEEDIDGDEFEIVLGFLPVSTDNPTDSDLQIYIINDSTYRMFYTVGKWKEKQIEPVSSGELEADSKKLIGIISKKEIAQIPVFQINFILFKNRNYTAQVVQQIDYQLNPVKFLKNGTFKENDFFEQNAYIYTLTSSRKVLADYVNNLSDKDIAKSQKNKRDFSKKPMPRVTEEIEEVDLHIESLVENKNELSNGDMIKLQIDRFIIALDLSISAKTKRMVFIHGIGNGKLKQEIRRLCDTKYAGKVRYQDASFEEYGYGATMVYIK
jgi:hypothetical protein